MDYDPNQFPFERDDPPEDHFTFADGVSRGDENGDKFKALRAANMIQVQKAKHCRQARTS